MKKISLLFIISMFVTFANAQDTLLLRPGPIDGKDARLNEHQPYLNFGGSEDFLSYFWTFAGNPAKGVSIIQFDLSEIPSQMIILDAKLSLYHNPESSSAGQAGENASYLKKITSYWNEYDVTWNSMPNTTQAGAVFLSNSVNSNQDYLDIDVTDIVSEWHENPENNFGLMLEILEASLYRSMLFASSDCLDESLRPTLMVVYAKEVPLENCITIQPGPDESIDARLHGYYPNTNYGNTDEFLSYYWTFNGSAAPGYSVIKFDLNQIPNNAIIQSANLSLYHINSPSAGQYGNNECYLRKITENWDENIVTWNTMPDVTNQDEVYLPQSLYSDQDYENIDLTEFVTDWYSNPENNFGMMLQINEFELYRSMKFASGDCMDPTLRPKLEVCYDVINETNSYNYDKFTIFPNPTEGLLFIQSPTQNYFLAQIYNLQGTLVYSDHFNKINNKIDVQFLPSGVYMIKITLPDSTFIRKFVKK